MAIPVLYSIPASTSWSGNPIRFVAGTDTSLDTEGLHIAATIFFRSAAATAFAEAITFPLTPDAQGLVEIDVANILHRLLSIDPPPQELEVVATANAAGVFYVRFTEKTLANPAGDTPMDTDEFSVIRGGIAYEQWQGSGWFANIYPTPRKILSWYSSTRQLFTWQQLWLSYLHLTAATTGTVAVEHKVFYTDGTTETLPAIPFPDDEALPLRTYHIPAGYDQLDMANADPDKRVHYYTLQVMEDDTALSELITTYPDYRPVYEPTQFLYVNSLGGFDTIAILGEQDEGLRREFELVDYNVSRARLNTYNLPAQGGMNAVSEAQTFRGNIGNTDDATLQDLRRELFLSTQLWEPKYGRWWPINILNSTVGKGMLDAQVRNIQVEWGYAWQNPYFTPENIGDEPEPSVACPVGTVDVAFNSGTLSFSHTPGPIDTYSAQLHLDADDSTVGSPTLFTIPFGSTMLAAWAGLGYDTAYYVRLTLSASATGYTTTCDYALTTAAEPEDMPPLDGAWEAEVVLGGAPDAGIQNISFDGMPVAVSSGYFTITQANPASGTVPTGTATLVVVYTNCFHSTIVVTDSNNDVQERVVSYSGAATFEDFVIDDTTTINVQIF